MIHKHHATPNQTTPHCNNHITQYHLVVLKHGFLIGVVFSANSNKSNGKPILLLEQQYSFHPGQDTSVL